MDEALARRRAGDSAAQSPRLSRRTFNARPAAFVVRCPQCDLALTFHRHDNTAMCHYCDYQAAGADDVPRVRVRGHPLQRPGHAKAGSRSAGAVSRLSVPADGHRQHARPRQPRAGARRVSRRPAADPARHADDRQGARLSRTSRWWASSMPTRRCTCPTSARPSGRFNS